MLMLKIIITAEAKPALVGPLGVCLHLQKVLTQSSEKVLSDVRACSQVYLGSDLWVPMSVCMDVKHLVET